jgi:hypothetical protein
MVPLNISQSSNINKIFIKPTILSYILSYGIADWPKHALGQELTFLCKVWPVAELKN